MTTGSQQMVQAAAHVPQLVRIARGTALFAAGTVFGLGLNYVYGIVLARLLGADDFGLYSLGLALFNVLTVIAIAGLDNAALKFVADTKAQGNSNQINGVVRAALLLSLAFGGIAALLLVFTAHGVAHTVFAKDALEPVLWWFAIGIPAFSVSAVMIAVLQANQDVVWRTSIKYLMEPIVKAVLTLILVWVGWGLEGAIIASVAALVGSVMLSLIPLRPFLRRSVSGGGVRGHAGAILSFSSPLLLALLAASVANRTDLLLLGYWWPSSDVGIYAAAFQTATVLTVILGCLESIATPYLSESVAASDWKHTNILYGTVVRWSCVCALPLCLIMLLFPAQILSIFGPTFQAGAGCLIILACGHLINAVTACANNALLWAGHSRRVMWNYLIVAAAQIAADLALIPRYGMVGAACGAFFGLLLMNWLRTWQASHLIGIHPFPATLTKPLAAGAAGVVFLLGVRWLLPQAGPFPQVMLLLGSYVGVLLLLGLEQDDLRVCRQLPLIGGVVR
ncbi:MAG: flippase [Nitrospira sp.]|nr:MAG: flippase [Nitrospira sp.]